MMKHTYLYCVDVIGRNKDGSFVAHTHKNAIAATGQEAINKVLRVLLRKTNFRKPVYTVEEVHKLGEIDVR